MYIYIYYINTRSMSVFLEIYYFPAAEQSLQNNTNSQINVHPAKYGAGRQGSSSKNLVTSNYAINIPFNPIKCHEMPYNPIKCRAKSQWMIWLASIPQQMPFNAIRNPLETRQRLFFFAEPSGATKCTKLLVELANLWPPVNHRRDDNP